LAWAESNSDFLELPGDLFCPSSVGGRVGRARVENLTDLHTRNDTHRIYFSRVVGEQATFMVTAEGMLKDYGIHTDQYLEHLVHLKYMR
jgi:hypothetical protein